MGFLFGTQYYRYPTPSPEYWERDIEKARELGLDFIQLRPQWRVHERREGVYEWDDLDRLFGICREKGMKIIFKFLLETGPEWLFDRYRAFRVAPDGRVLTPYSNGSYYVGGMIPCFDHPVVRERAAAFVKEAVKRYAGAGHLIYWHLWNEPRNRPYGECACEHSVKLYREWLRERFKSVEKYNKRMGLSEGAFEEIKPPVNYANFSTTALWKEWCRGRVAERLRLVAAAIRAMDKKRPLMTHVGMCSLLQDILNDGSDDYQNAKETDVYGCSYVTWAGECLSFARLERDATFTDREWRRNVFIYSMQTDWLRGLKKDFWVNEFYANAWSMESPDFTAEDIRLRLYEAAGNGVQGVNLWQFRPEKLCNESGAFGLINPDGTDTPRSLEVRAFNDFRKAHPDLLEGYKKDKGDIAIVYDAESDMISRLEETDASNEGNRVSYRYKNSIKGWYGLLWRNRMNIDFIPSQEFERIREYRAVVLPYMTRMNEKQAGALKAYVSGGGVVFADPCPGMRDERNFLRDALPPFGLEELFKVRHGLPKLGKLGFKTPVNRYGKGIAVYFNRFPGEREEPGLAAFVKKTMGFRDFFRAPGLVAVKRGKSGGREVLFVLNYENRALTVDLPAWKRKIRMAKREAGVLWR